jgi:vitamin B12 transporter
LVSLCSHRAAWLAVVLAPVAAPHVAAQQPQLPEVVVVGSREPKPIDRVTADVVVIDTQRLRESTADSVEDVLRREAGVQLSRNGGPGTNASVFIRGSGASSTLVLIDGVRIGSGTLGQAALEGLSLAQVDRIEVLRGPGSSLYGADAVGGVIQIFTRRGEGPARWSGRAAVGGYGSREGNLGVSGSRGPVDLAASVAHERSDGTSTLRPGDQFGNHNPDDDGHRRTSGQAQLGWTPATGHRLGLNLNASRLNSQYDASEFLAPDFLPDATPDFRNRLNTQVLAADYRGALTKDWTTTVQLSRNDDRLRSGGTVTSRFETQREQLSWQNAIALGERQQVIALVEYLEEAARSSSYAQAEKRDNKALALVYSGGFGKHEVQLDVRHDDSSVYGSVDTGRLGWSYQIAAPLRVRALVGTTFRAPSFNDLYFPGYGVDSIEPERGRSAELGLNWQQGASSAALTVYRNRVRDLIAYEPDRSFCPPDESFDFGCAANVDRARLQGATVDLGHRFGAWSLRATLDYLDATDLDTGEQLRRRAHHQESVHADYRQGPWSGGVSLLSVGSRPDDGVTLGGVTTIDLRAAWRFAAQWQAEAKLLNATDRDLEPARDYQGLGRQAWVGVRFDGVGF